MTGVTSKAKEVAQRDVLSRVVTIEQAKESYKYWIKSGLSKGGFNQETIDFWEEVYNQVDMVVPKNLDASIVNAEKAKKYDELKAKIAAVYDEDELEFPDEGDRLISIGEIAASHFGFM